MFSWGGNWSSFLLLTVVVCGCSGSSEFLGENEHCDVWGDGEYKVYVQDANLVEISGVVASRTNQGVLWVHEDSGSAPVVTALDRQGTTLGTITLKGVTPTDWEDIALGPCGSDVTIDSSVVPGADCLWIGDFGDNKETRSDASLLKFMEPDLADLTIPFSMEVSPVVYPFSYPDGAQDAEALVVTPNGLPIVLTKRTTGTSLFGLRHENGVPGKTLEHLGDLHPADGDSVTGADLSEDGQRLLVRSYFSITAFELVWPKVEEVVSVPEFELLYRIPPAFEPQGEAITWLSPREFLTVSEGKHPSFVEYSCTLEGVH